MIFYEFEERIKLPNVHSIQEKFVMESNVVSKEDFIKLVKQWNNEISQSIKIRFVASFGYLT